MEAEFYEGVSEGQEPSAAINGQEPSAPVSSNTEISTQDLSTSETEEEQKKSVKKQSKQKQAEKEPVSGHPEYEQVQLYRNGNKIEEGRVIKKVRIEKERAERMNSQSFNTLIRYRLVQS